MPPPPNATVVFGPRTRLGAEFVRGAAPVRRSLYAAARNGLEVEAVRAAWPGATVLLLPGLAGLDGRAADCVEILLLAFGPVRPGPGGYSDGQAAFARDLAGIDAILDARRGGKLRVVLVSTVLALAGPRPSRLGYAGWKLLAEAAVRERLAGCAGATLSVLYPGRLIAGRRLSKPSTWLATSYRKLARMVAKAASAGIPGRRVVGLDARLWLLFQGFRTALRGLGGPC